MFCFKSWLSLTLYDHRSVPPTPSVSSSRVQTVFSSFLSSKRKMTPHWYNCPQPLQSLMIITHTFRWSVLTRPLVPLVVLVRACHFFGQNQNPVTGPVPVPVLEQGTNETTPDRGFWGGPTNATTPDRGFWGVQQMRPPQTGFFWGVRKWPVRSRGTGPVPVVSPVKPSKEKGKTFVYY